MARFRALAMTPARAAARQLWGDSPDGRGVTDDRPPPVAFAPGRGRVPPPGLHQRVGPARAAHSRRAGGADLGRGGRPRDRVASQERHRLRDLPPRAPARSSRPSPSRGTRPPPRSQCPSPQRRRRLSDRWRPRASSRPRSAAATPAARDPNIFPLSPRSAMGTESPLIAAFRAHMDGKPERAFGAIAELDRTNQELILAILPVLSRGASANFAADPTDRGRTGQTTPCGGHPDRIVRDS